MFTEQLPKKWMIAFLSAWLVMLGQVKSEAALFASEKEITRQARVQWLTMKRSMPLAPTERLQRYVECVAYNLINILEQPYASMDWEVVVFDDDALNAFAMPGGKIGVFTGLLSVADGQDALAAVIGHEIAHMTQDHVMDRAKKDSRTDILVLLGSAATGIRQDLLRQGAALGLSLPFDRRQESEADIIGMQYMAEAGFDPRATIYLWKNMAAQRQGGPPEFLSTHPGDDKRMGDLVRSMTPALIQYNEAREAGKRPNCGG
ncbi:MAG: M48 family metallopeptidase [Gammaproteobacteria bacterium]